MNFKSNKGITLISLVIAIIVIFTIGGAIIYNSNNQISIRKINNLYNDIDTINGKVDNYYMNYGELPVLCEFKTINSFSKEVFEEYLKSLAEQRGATLNYYPDSVNPNDGDEYYVIDLEKLDGLTLNYGYEDDYKTVKENKAITLSNVEDEIYIINGVTHQVYFPHGVIVDNIMYYTYKMNESSAEISTPKTKADLKVGDYVNYTYDSTVSTYTLEGNISGYRSAGNYSEKDNPNPTDFTPITYTRASTMNWRILSLNDDGSVDLIGISNGVTEDVYLQGSRGYNNGVFILNDMVSKMYSNSKLGSKAIARSLNIDDIENLYIKDTDGKGINARNAYANSYATYGGNGATAISGTTKDYTGSSRYYPTLYKQEKYSGIDSDTVKTDGLDQSEGRDTGTYEQATNKLRLTQTYYYKSYTDLIDSGNPAKALLPTSRTWIASRYVSCEAPHADFGIRFLFSNGVSGFYLVNSNAYAHSRSYALRPVIHLDKSVNFNVKAGTEEEMHEILY